MFKKYLVIILLATTTLFFNVSAFAKNDSTYLKVTNATKSNIIKVHEGFIWRSTRELTPGETTIMYQFSGWITRFYVEYLTHDGIFEEVPGCSHPILFSDHVLSVKDRPASDADSNKVPVPYCEITS